MTFSKMIRLLAIVIIIQYQGRTKGETVKNEKSTTSKVATQEGSEVEGTLSSFHITESLIIFHVLSQSFECCFFFWRVVPKHNYLEKAQCLGDTTLSSHHPDHPKWKKDNLLWHGIRLHKYYVYYCSKLALFLVVGQNWFCWKAHKNIIMYFG